MADVDYRANPAGIAEMLRSPAMLKKMEHIGEVVRIEAERNAPVDYGAYAFGLPSPKATGGGFAVKVSIRNGVASVRISNNVRSKPSKKWPQGYGYGWALEHGNARIRKRRILGRALDVAATRL